MKRHTYQTLLAARAEQRSHIEKRCWQHRAVLDNADFPGVLLHNEHARDVAGRRREEHRIAESGSDEFSRELNCVRRQCNNRARKEGMRKHRGPLHIHTARRPSPRQYRPRTPIRASPNRQFKI